MIQTKGFFSTTASGAVTQKYFNSNQNGSYAYISIVREEEYKDENGIHKLKHYLKLRLRGKQAEFINEYVNKGDSLVVIGDLVNENDANGKFKEQVLRVVTIQQHQMPSRATQERIVNARAAKQARQQQAPTPPQQQAQAQAQKPQQAPVAPMDFDDDIPF